ncbi:MAG: DegV family protein [Peptostreptococcaceae bacterium]
MSNIKIICETMNDLPDGLLDIYPEIEVLPVTIVFEGKEYKAGVDLDTNEFYKMLRTSESMPSTSQVTYATFKDIFDKHLKEGKKILYMAGSSAASGTYQSAMIAKNDIESDDIYIFDTFGVSLAGGLLIEQAAKLSSEGHDIDFIINKLEEYKEKVHIYFSVDSLDYLQKGGRISGTKAAIGTLLNIKPILKIEDGLVKQKGQVRGSKKIMPALITEIKKEVGDDCTNKDIYIGYGDDLSIRDEFIDRVKKELSPRNVYTFQIGSCVACHSGPNVFGIGCLNI